MKIIVGLGNPGAEYENTRHNAGYLFVDSLSNTSEFVAQGSSDFSNDKKFNALVLERVLNDEKFIFIKPLTYMNLSGHTVAKILNFYKITADDLIVISDDIDLPLGSARIRNESSRGGQSGLQNIIDQLGHHNFTRVRLGIRPVEGVSPSAEHFDKIATSDFVLGKFENDERDLLNKVIDASIEYIVPFLSQNITILPHSINLK
ncbi:MAG: aminoacyl-tRNA hydrolase [bacterium]